VTVPAPTDAPTDPLPPLVTTSDPDYALFKAGDEEYLLKVASAAIRDYCGWHIAPSLTATYTKLEVGSKNIIMLPSRYVTDVSEVRAHQLGPQVDPPPDELIVNPSEYEWFQDGWIQGRTTYSAGWGWPGAGYYGPEAPYPAVGWGTALVDVTMTHGYEELPANLKQVAFELAQSTATTAGLISGVKSIKSPQYSADFTEAVKAGMSFSPDQVSTLADYKLGWFT
jgi:hypothetical protein